MRQGLIGQIAGQLRAGMFDFGGIVAFYLLLWCVGIKAAIAGTIVFIVLDAIRRIRRKLGFPRIYLLSNTLVVCFGAIDLLSANPFMIKDQVVISSLAVGAMFALGARGRSIIQELVEQQSGEADDSPDFAPVLPAHDAALGGVFRSPRPGCISGSARSCRSSARLKSARSSASSALPR